MTTFTSTSIADSVICGRCPAIYTADEIRARHGDEETTLAALNETSTTRPTKGGMRKLVRKASTATPDTYGKIDLDQIRKFRDYTFLCPQDHLVSGNKGASLPLAVVGSNGASKSHFLPGLVLEVKTRQALHPVGVSVRDGLYTGVGLSSLIERVYMNHEVLPATPAGGFNGPYSYQLGIRQSGLQQDLLYSLQLFDVSGEELASVVKIGENAKFVLLSRGVIVLIDPVGVVPTKFDDLGNPATDVSRELTAERSRNGISRIADALQEVWQRPSRALKIPLVIVIAKADGIEWDFDWRVEASRIEQDRADQQNSADHVIDLEAANRKRDQVTTGGEDALRRALEASSDRVREAFSVIGGQGIVREVFDRFDLSQVRFVAASATGEMPTRVTNATGDDESQWVNPQPIGVAVALLHVLQMLGTIPDTDTSIG